MKKNVAGQKVGAQMITASDGSAFTSAVTVEVTIDAGTQATGTVGSGAAAHEGNGYHTYAPSQAETNGDLLAYTFHGSGAIPATMQASTVQWQETQAIKAKTDNLPSDPADQSLVIAAIDAVPAAVWALVVVGSKTAIQLMRGFASALLGKVSGVDTFHPIFRDTEDTKDVIDATGDGTGNRTTVTLDLT